MPSPSIASPTVSVEPREAGRVVAEPCSNLALTAVQIALNTHISAQLLYPVLERNHRLSPRYLSAPATGANKKAFAIGSAPTALECARLCPALRALASFSRMSQMENWKP